MDDLPILLAQLERMRVTSLLDRHFLTHGNWQGLTLGTGKGMSAHNCRRYMATTQLASGRSPLDLQRQMGHTTLTMTNYYASLTVQQLQKSHE